jgi:putative membrane protein
MMGWYGWGWSSWLTMTLMMLLFWGLIAFAVVAVVRSLRSAPHQTDTRSDAGRVLDERLARGEIDEEDYRKRRDLLARR